MMLMWIWNNVNDWIIIKIKTEKKNSYSVMIIAERRGSVRLNSEHQKTLPLNWFHFLFSSSFDFFPLDCWNKPLVEQEQINQFHPMTNNSNNNKVCVCVCVIQNNKKRFISKQSRWIYLDVVVWCNTSVSVCTPWQLFCFYNSLIIIKFDGPEQDIKKLAWCIIENWKIIIK